MKNNIRWSLVVMFKKGCIIIVFGFVLMGTVKAQAQCSLSPAPSPVFFTAAGSVQSVAINGIGDCSLTVVSYPSWISSVQNNHYEISIYPFPNTGAQRAGSVTLDYGGNPYYVSLTQAGVPIPAITSQPSNQNKCASLPVTFTVAASNATSYQWYKSSNGGSTYSIVSGATSSSYTFTATTALNNTRYRCVISNVSGSVTSTGAILTVSAATQVGSPLNVTVCSNAANATFSIGAAGSNLTFQWQRAINGGGFVALASEPGFSGINGPVLTVGDVNGNANAQFRCYVTGTCPGGGPSTAATLFVTSTEIQISSPSNQFACPGALVTFSVSASGATYQWEESDNISTNFSWIPGATSSTYQFTATAGKANYKYRCIVTGPCGNSQTSSYATLSILSAPNITQHPSNKSVCAGSSTFFDVMAANATQYQWQYQSPGSSTWVNSTDPGAGTNKVTPQLVNNIKYRCIVTGACSPTQTSQPASLTVRASAQVSNPTDVTVCANEESAIFSVVGSGGEPLSYKWERSINNGVFVQLTMEEGFTGIDQPALTVHEIAENIDAKFRCVVSGCGNSTSNFATLFEAPSDLSFSNPDNELICPGDEATFVVNSTNAISYQWEEKTTASSEFVPIEGATFSTYQFTPTQINAGAEYRCNVGGNCGVDRFSEAATLEFHNVSSSIIQQPLDQSVCVQENVNFSVETTDPGLLYQWQVSTNAGSSFTDVVGETDAIFSFPSTSGLNGNKYKVIVRHPVCNTFVTSTIVTLTVLPNPVLSATINASSTSVSIGEDVNLTITPTSPGPSETWRWYVVNNDNSLTIGSGPSITVSPAHTTTYHVNASICNGTSKGITINSIERFSNENYVYTIEPKVPMDATMTLRTDDNVIEGITYFDGLGRPMQSIAIKSSPARNDIISPIVYDSLGREAKKFLPFVNGNNGYYTPTHSVIDSVGNYIGVAEGFYGGGEIAGDDRPFSETFFEASPLNRPDKVYGPGRAWAPEGVGSNNKYVKHQYLSNTHSLTGNQYAEAIIAWTVGEGGMLLRKPYVEDYITNGGYYDSNQLSVKVTLDEHGYAVREYTNKQGQMILKKVQAIAKLNSSEIDLNNTSEWACTYYIYDDLGNLRIVLPPEGVKQYLDVVQN